MGAAARALAQERYSWDVDRAAARRASTRRRGRVKRRRRPPCRVRSLGRARVGCVLGGVVALFWWRGPSFSAIGDAFTGGQLAVGRGRDRAQPALGGRARARLDDGDPRRRCRRRTRASARLLRVLGRPVRERRPARPRSASSRASPCSTRKLPGRQGAWATLVGTVFAHRVFDVVPVLLLVLYVIVDREHPDLRRGEPARRDRRRRRRAVRVRVRQRAQRTHATRSKGSARCGGCSRWAAPGLGVMRSPVGAAGAIFFQICGWVCQLLAVCTAMRAFDIHSPLAGRRRRAAADERRRRSSRSGPATSASSRWRSRLPLVRLRRRVRARRRVRLRAAGDRGVGRRSASG